MRTATARRLAVPALAALIALAGCGGDGDDDGSKASTTTAGETSTTADDGATTTEAGADGSTTTEAGDEGSTTTEAGDGGDEGSTTVPDTSSEGQEGTGAPDAEAPDVSWDLNAAQYRGEDGKRIAFLCPPDGEIGAVWGTETYTDDSSVCSAAVHAGLINPIEGGRIIVEIAPGEETYEGTEANGVTSQDYGAWDGSFTFPKA